MWTIFKYPLEITDEQLIPLPMDARVLSVGLSGGRPCLWALVDSALPPAPWRIHIYGTGQPVDHAQHEFIGTVVDDRRGLVWHVFVVPEGQGQDREVS